MTYRKIIRTKSFQVLVWHKVRSYTHTHKIHDTKFKYMIISNSKIELLHLSVSFSHRINAEIYLTNILSLTHLLSLSLCWMFEMFAHQLPGAKCNTIHEPDVMLNSVYKHTSMQQQHINKKHKRALKRHHRILNAIITFYIYINVLFCSAKVKA